MLVADILNVISSKEGVPYYTFIPLNRWIDYKDAPIRAHIDFVEDQDFQIFFDFLKSIFSSGVRRHIAIKILNNGYFISRTYLPPSSLGGGVTPDSVGV